MYINEDVREQALQNSWHTALFPVPKPSDNTNVHVSSPHCLTETLDFSLYSCFRDNGTWSDVRGSQQKYSRLSVRHEDDSAEDLTFLVKGLLNQLLESLTAVAEVH